MKRSSYIAGLRGLTAALMGLILVCCLDIGSAWAHKTVVTVKVRAKDALFVGTPMGGAMVVIRDAITGEVLAKGLTKGRPGNPKVVMARPHTRNMVLGAGAAQFRAVLDLKEPRLVKIEAYGPMAQRQAAVTVSTEVWLIPGIDTPGDGIVLEMPGFVVDVAAPKAHAIRKAPVKEELVANVMPMCGCPINEHTFWDPQGLDVTAVVMKGGQEVKRVRLKYAGSTGRFSAPLTLAAPGVYRVWVYAFDPKSGNTGVDFTTLVVRP